MGFYQTKAIVLIIIGYFGRSTAARTVRAMLELPGAIEESREETI
jgi:hypothetical protein